MSRAMGLFICLISLAATGAFIWGLVLRSYWAVAIPVAVVTLGLLALMFWIGWALVITDWVTPPPSDAGKDGSA